MAAIDKTYVNNWPDYEAIRNWAKSIGTVTDDYGNKLTPFNWLYYPDLTEEEFYKNQKECWEEAKERYSDLSNPGNAESYQWMVENYGEDFLEHPELFYEIVIWNTNHIEDIFLIRHCPLEVIQNRLKQQYGGGWSKLAFTDHNSPSEYDKIKNRVSEYDNFQRNGLGKNVKFTISEVKTNWTLKDKDTVWFIDIINDRNWNYSETENIWYHDYECYVSKDEWISSSCWYKFRGKMTPRRIYRILRKWNLPAGIKLHFVGDWKRVTIQDFVVTTK